MIDISKLKEQSKHTVRKPTASVDIVWAGKSVNNAEVNSAVSRNRICVFIEGPDHYGFEQQVIEGIGEQRKWFFAETGSNPPYATLDGSCYLMPDNEKQKYLVGWWGSDLSSDDGTFAIPQVIKIKFAAQPVSSVHIKGYLDDTHPNKEYPVDFTITLYKGNGEMATEPITKTGNESTDCQVTFGTKYNDITCIEVTITKWSHPLAFVKITGMFDEFKKTYEDDDIMSLSILEEAEGSVGALPIGHISCNQIDLTLQNLEDDYFIGNYDSSIGGMAKANRRIEPHIGFQVIDDNGVITDEILTITKGVYWTSDWNVSDDGSGASTSALDRLGLLQDIEYRGIGDVDDAEETVWENVRGHRPSK